MSMVRKYVQEAASLAKSASGTYRVRLIDEGEGSSGSYSRELIESSAHVFEGVPSFFDHPINPEAPHERSVLTIGGRISNVTAEYIEEEDKTALFGDFKPRAEYEPFIEQFADVIGLSIYCGAYGDQMDDGRFAVESFDGEDPYRSCDLVVAAGRGGKFERAKESLRAIESRIGTSNATKPGSASGSDSNTQQEESMELKDVEALFDAKLAEALKPINTFLAEEGARRQAEADAAANDDDVADAIEAAVATVEAIKVAKVLPSFEAKLIESAKKGVDVTEDLDFAKKITAEASVSAKDEGDSFYTHESKSNDADFSINLGGRF